MKKLKSQIAELGLSFGKEIAFYFFMIALLGFLGAFLYLRYEQPSFILAPTLLLLLFTYWYFSRYGNEIAAKRRNDEEEFVRLFTYFGIYIGNGYNVYNALERISDFASERMRPKLLKLLQGIEGDKSITPFMDYSENFDDLSIKEVMVAIYQMVEEGGVGAYLEQFRHLFGKLSDAKYAAIKKNRISRLDDLTSLPLIGSGISMVALTLALVGVMGEMSNVL